MEHPYPANTRVCDALEPHPFLGVIVGHFYYVNVLYYVVVLHPKHSGFIQNDSGVSIYTRHIVLHYSNALIAEIPDA